MRACMRGWVGVCGWRNEWSIALPFRRLVFPFYSLRSVASKRHNARLIRYKLKPTTLENMAQLELMIFVCFCLFVRLYVTTLTLWFSQAIVCGKPQVKGQATVKVSFFPHQRRAKDKGHNLEKYCVPRREHALFFFL